MIIDLPPQTELAIIEQAQKQGISVNELIAQYAQPKSVIDLVKGKHLQGFNDDPLAIQKALRALEFAYTPNKETLQAVDELASGKGAIFANVDELMADLNA